MRVAVSKPKSRAHVSHGQIGRENIPPGLGLALPLQSLHSCFRSRRLDEDAERLLLFPVGNLITWSIDAEALAIVSFTHKPLHTPYVSPSCPASAYTAVTLS